MLKPTKIIPTMPFRVVTAEIERELPLAKQPSGIDIAHYKLSKNCQTILNQKRRYPAKPFLTTDDDKIELLPLPAADERENKQNEPSLFCQDSLNIANIIFEKITNNLVTMRSKIDDYIDESPRLQSCLKRFCCFTLDNDNKEIINDPKCFKP